MVTDVCYVNYKRQRRLAEIMCLSTKQFENVLKLGSPPEEILYVQIFF